MIEAVGLPAWLQAVLLVGVVLVEAVLLYVGYGYLEDRAAPRVIETIQNT